LFFIDDFYKNGLISMLNDSDGSVLVIYSHVTTVERDGFHARLGL
jgi:hypothetical protein